jgi:hypothetical protein
VSHANDRAFNRFLVAMGVSNLGDGVRLTALPLLVARGDLSRTSSPMLKPTSSTANAEQRVVRPDVLTIVA